MLCSVGEHTEDLCPWLDGEIEQASVMDASGCAQVAPFELCTKLMDAALAKGARLLKGTVGGVETKPGADGLKEVVAVCVDGG